MVMYAPGGVASLIMMNLRLANSANAAAVVSYLGLLAGCPGAAGRGLIGHDRMGYRLQLNAAARAGAGHHSWAPCWNAQRR